MKNNKRRKNVIKRKGRISLIMIVICLVIISFVSQVSFAEEQIEVNEITVNECDTLWNIASDICEENDNLNIQNVIIEIKKINGLNTSDIYIGQQLFIPQY